MKRILKIIIILLCFIPLINIQAKNNYEIKKYYIKSEIELAGAIRIREIYEIKGDCKEFTKDLYFKDDTLTQFENKKEDLKHCSIHNGAGVSDIKVGIVDITSLKFSQYDGTFIDENVKYLEKVEDNKELKDGGYIENKLDDRTQLKIYNNNSKKITYYYIEYTITNVLVEHKDSAEFYYTFIRKEFDKSIDDVKILVLLPFASKDLFEVWGHGQTDAEVIKDNDKNGALIQISNYKAGSGVDLRMLFDKKVFAININEYKKTNIDAVEYIKNFENSKIKTSDTKRFLSDIIKYAFIGLEIIFILYFIFYITNGLIIKKKKNFKKEKYYTKIIDDYKIENVEYLLSHNISATAFNSSILNLIYKDVISVKKVLKNNIIDYEFTKNKKINVSDEENIILNILFNIIGKNNNVMLSKITNAYNKNIYTEFLRWRKIVIENSKSLNFFEENIKLKYLLLGIFGIILSIFDYLSHNSKYILYITFIVSFIFILFILLFKFKTIKGKENIYKWKKFKKYLKKFNKLKENQLPEIKLWEQYLVYATVFDLNEKISEKMYLKLKEIRPKYNSSNNDSLFNYFIFNDLTYNITKNIKRCLNLSKNAK